MCRLLETIRIKNGFAENLNYHQSRIDKAFETLFTKSKSINLENYLNKLKLPHDGIYKCRILYDDQNIEYEIIKYQFPEIHSLKIVFDDDIDYSYKYADRENLQKLFSQREQCDDILIIKNGIITDTYFANIVFFENETWFTPKYPLLQGTKRAKYLTEGIIFEKNITIDNLKDFKYAKIINSMIDIDDLPEIEIDKII